eukprot:3507778-Pyramimonas_sp.AAC.1
MALYDRMGKTAKPTYRVASARPVDVEVRWGFEAGGDRSEHDRQAQEFCGLGGRHSDYHRDDCYWQCYYTAAQAEN